MISNFKSSKETVEFQFKDISPSLLNSIRRTSLGNLDVYSINLLSLKGPNNINFEDIDSLLESVYLNHNNLRKIINKIPDITLNLNVKAVNGPIEVWTRDIECSEKNLFRKDIYICTLHKDQELVFVADIKKKPRKLVSTFGYDYTIKDNLYYCNAKVCMLEIYSFYDSIRIWLNNLIDNIKIIYNTQITEPKFILDNPKLSHTEYFLIQDYITRTNPDIIFIYSSKHSFTCKTTIELLGKNKPIASFLKSLEDLVKKINSVYTQIEDKLKTQIKFNTVITDY